MAAAVVPSRTSELAHRGLSVKVCRGKEDGRGDAFFIFTLHYKKQPSKSRLKEALVQREESGRIAVSASNVGSK